MTRIFSSPEERLNPRIEKESVARFFLERARKVETVGPVRAVIYQDKHPDLAEKRDISEKERLLPLLKLDGLQRVLDIGCGTGRWTRNLIEHCNAYHGIDFSPELIEHARSSYPASDKLRFSVAPAENYSLESLAERQPFDRILCCGVMIYLNDEDVESALHCMASVAAPCAYIVLREPMGIGRRLTIKEHFSEELEQNYNAIYRTQEELENHLSNTLYAAGFTLATQCDVYDAHLNNRVETVQRALVLERI